MKQLKVSYFLRLSLLLCVVLLTACVNDDDDGVTMKVKVGDAVPSFVLDDELGNELRSASLNGQVFLLNFIDTNCPDCRNELQVLQRIYDKYQDEVPILNVPRSQTKEELQAYWEQAELTLPFYIPRNQQLYYLFASKIVPRTYVIDSNGKVYAAFTDSPIADFDTLDGILQQLLGDDDKVNLSIKLRVQTRGIEEYYFHNEYTVSNLHLYFFDSETKKFYTKGVITDLTKDDSSYDTEYDITYHISSLKLRGGVYDILAIANYDNAPDEVENEAELLDMIDDITYKDGFQANIPDKGPVMTNRASSLMEVDLTPWIGKTHVLTIEMERVLAKLQIGVSQNVFHLMHDGQKYADVNITNYKLVNMNKQYYLFQHRDILPEFIARSTPYTMPFNYSDYLEQVNEYVIDPFFYQKTAITSDAERFRDYYQSWYGNFTTEGFASMPAADSYGYVYVLENTCFKTSQKNGYTPGVVFKGAVNPVFVYLYDNVLKDLVSEPRPEYWPNTIYLYNYNFYGSIHALNIASGLTLDELVDHTDAELKQYGIKQCKFNMGVYETFYTYWINHLGSSATEMNPMEYGLVRNHFYRMRVVGVSGIGSSVITPDIMRDNRPTSVSFMSVEAN